MDQNSSPQPVQILRKWPWLSGKFHLKTSCSWPKESTMVTVGTISSWRIPDHQANTTKTNWSTKAWHETITKFTKASYYILVYSADEPWKICTWFPPESSMHRLNILSYFNQDNSCSPCRCARELVVLEELAFNKTTVETSEFSHCEAQNEAKCGHMACMHPSWNLQTHRSTQTSSSNFFIVQFTPLNPKILRWIPIPEYQKECQS